MLFLSAAVILSLPGCTEEQDVFPILDVIEVAESDITSSSAILKGEITRLGNVNIREYGIEISKNMIFSPSQTKGFTTPAAMGVYQVEFTGLEPGMLYYYRSYASINTAQVYSQGYRTFTTLP